ncbi:hypothetical protein ACTMU2_04910 [Cupriavidus basilensis]
MRTDEVAAISSSGLEFADGAGQALALGFAKFLRQRQQITQIPHAAGFPAFQYPGTAG